MDTRILVVDDETTIRTVIARVLEQDGYRVTEAASAEEALDRFREEPFPIVMTDIVMEDMTGLDLLEEVRLLDDDALVVVMTSQASLDAATSALRAGAYDFLVKPFEDLDVVSAVVRRATDKVRLLTHNRTLMESLKESTVELERLNRRLTDMAHRDGLTGLFNHRYFREALQLELARATRYDRRFSLLFMDVDDFKVYNDTHGHLAGDEVLRKLAGILRAGARRSTVLARYGGEEFVALLPETEREGARRYAEAIIEAVAGYKFAGGDTQPSRKVTLSIGVAAFPDDGTDGKSLLKHADDALYRAKQQGKNRVCG